MSREQAHQVLDDAKEGLPVSEWTIRRALQATGDLEHQWPQEDEE